jgi:hypothetical protein
MKVIKFCVSACLCIFVINLILCIVNINDVSYNGHLNRMVTALMVLVPLSIIFIIVAIGKIIFRSLKHRDAIITKSLGSDFLHAEPEDAIRGEGRPKHQATFRATRALQPPKADITGFGLQKDHLMLQQWYNNTTKAQKSLMYAVSVLAILLYGIGVIPLVVLLYCEFGRWR